MRRSASRRSSRLLASLFVVFGSLGDIAAHTQDAPLAKPPANVEQPPRLIKRVDPIPPDTAGTDILDGDVILAITIRTDGTVKVDRVAHGLPMLAAAAIHAASQWLYEPGRHNGVATPVETIIAFHFKNRSVGDPVVPPRQGAVTMSAPPRTAPPPPPQGVVRISAGVMATMLQKRVDPVYPRNSVAPDAQGNITMLVTVDRTGAVRDAEVVSGPFRFRDAAIDAVKQWRYRPYLIEGEPAEVQTVVILNFVPPR